MTDLWYALHVKPRFEKYVQTHLQDKGYEVFLPTYTSRRQWSDRVKSISLPLFPGYIFCRFQIQSRFPVLVTPGVNFIVGIGKSPVPVDDKEIRAIRQVVDSGILAQPCAYLGEGESVRVEDGPLQGLVGTVVRTKGVDRLVISVTLLMRSLSVELDRYAVKPVEELKEHTGLAAGSNVAKSDSRPSLATL
jgi:transcription antitermination factor NusG